MAHTTLLLQCICTLQLSEARSGFGVTTCLQARGPAHCDNLWVPFFRGKMSVDMLSRPHSVLLDCICFLPVPCLSACHPARLDYCCCCCLGWNRQVLSHDPCRKHSSRIPSLSLLVATLPVPGYTRAARKEKKITHPFAKGTAAQRQILQYYSHINPDNVFTRCSGGTIAARAQIISTKGCPALNLRAVTRVVQPKKQQSGRAAGERREH